MNAKVVQFVVAGAIAAGAFAILAQGIEKLEFTSASENAVVESALEMRRGGPWVVPTLHDDPRTKKPPLANWLTAAAIRPQTVEQLSSRDSHVRAAAYEGLAWQARWPALVAACAMLAAVYGLEVIVEDIPVGLGAALVCGSSLMFLRHARLATTDVHLALCVTCANLLLAYAVLDRKWWIGLPGAGIAIGLALMSKGPVALAQTIVPVAMFVVWRRWAVPRDDTRRCAWFLPLCVGGVLMLAVGLWWYAQVFREDPRVLSKWWVEVTRQGATESEPDSILNYLAFFAWLFPWCAFFVAGMIGAGIALARRANPRIVLMLFLLVVPILAMSFFRDRKDRYLLPMLGPAAVIVAWGTVEFFRTYQGRRASWLVPLLHWLPLTSVAILAITQNGKPWLTLRGQIMGGMMIVLCIGCGLILQRRRNSAWVAVIVPTAVLVLTLQMLLVPSYAASEYARSEMRPLAERIWQEVPDATIYSLSPHPPARHVPLELMIYLNRVAELLPGPEALDALPPGPHVLLIHQRRNRERPEPPAGWTYLDEVAHDRNRWIAFTDSGVR